VQQLGADVAGEVEAVGTKVTQFKPGDAVFGTCRGSLAEYACASASAVERMPANATFEQAASVPVAALTALQGLRDRGRIQSGQQVLINGASGGVGTFAVQIAKWLGTEVTGVCSTRNLDLVRSIGAHLVIDYNREDFTKNGQRYDLVYDCVWNHSLPECRRILKPKGRYVIVGGPSDQPAGALMRRAMRAFVSSVFTSRKFTMCVARSSQGDLNLLRELIENGHATPVIDRSYRLGESAAAISYLEQGHARGKVVISV
jgi:NADPH:quinone reductase-like Zn-dependent oxidoreductase